MQQPCGYRASCMQSSGARILQQWSGRCSPMTPRKLATSLAKEREERGTPARRTLGRGWNARSTKAWAMEALSAASRVPVGRASSPPLQPDCGRGGPLAALLLISASSYSRGARGTPKPTPCDSPDPPPPTPTPGMRMRHAHLRKVLRAQPHAGTVSSRWASSRIPARMIHDPCPFSSSRPHRMDSDESMCHVTCALWLWLALGRNLGSFEASLGPHAIAKLRVRASAMVLARSHAANVPSGVCMGNDGTVTNWLVINPYNHGWL